METPYRRPIQVLVYCFRRRFCSVDYLMLRRTAKYGGFWQGVTGAPEGDESLLDGARRELIEETRLSPKDLYQIDFSYSFSVEAEWKWAYELGVERIDEFVFLAEIAEDAEPVLSFEHDLYEWAGFDQAMSLLKWSNNREALEFCDRFLQEQNERDKIAHRLNELNSGSVTPIPWAEVRRRLTSDN